MDKGLCKVVGVMLLGASAICLFVAYDRYQTNLDNFRAFQSSPFSGKLSGGKLEPTTPAESKYAILVAVLLGVGGGMFLAQSRSRVTAGHAAGAD